MAPLDAAIPEKAPDPPVEPDAPSRSCPDRLYVVPPWVPLTSYE
jgi:hypothetical protein